jgi:hypothetical protein
MIDTAKAPVVGATDAVPSVTAKVPPGLSSWMLYNRSPECCGPVGGNGPIQLEVYLRTGPELPVEGKIFGHVLTPGWEIAGGGRSLFFNPEMDAAWTIDLGISNTQNQGQHSDIQIPYNLILATGSNPITGAPTGTTIQTVQLTVKNLNRTFANLGLGREWYLTGAANCGQPVWRVGIDGGPRLGTAKIEFHEFQHRNDVIGAAYVALHTDWECSCGGCCSFFAGLRAEWSYNWMDILQKQNDSDMMDLNLLMNFGVRY